MLIQQFLHLSVLVASCHSFTIKRQLPSSFSTGSFGSLLHKNTILGFQSRKEPLKILSYVDNLLVTSNRGGNFGQNEQEALALAFSGEY